MKNEKRVNYLLTRKLIRVLKNKALSENFKGSREPIKVRAIYNNFVVDSLGWQKIQDILSC